MQRTNKNIHVVKPGIIQTAVAPVERAPIDRTPIATQRTPPADLAATRVKNEAASAARNAANLTKHTANYDRQVANYNAMKNFGGSQDGWFKYAKDNGIGWSEARNLWGDRTGQHYGEYNRVGKHIDGRDIVDRVSGWLDNKPGENYEYSNSMRNLKAYMANKAKNPSWITASDPNGTYLAGKAGYDWTTDPSTSALFDRTNGSAATAATAAPGAAPGANPMLAGLGAPLAVARDPNAPGDANAAPPGTPGLINSTTAASASPAAASAAPAEAAAATPPSTADAAQQLAQAMQSMVAAGDEAGAKALYNSKKTQLGFTDADFAGFNPLGLGITADQLSQWSGNTAANAGGPPPAPPGDATATATGTGVINSTGTTGTAATGATGATNTAATTAATGNAGLAAAAQELGAAIRSMIAAGDEAGAKALYLSKKAQFGFTDGEFASLSGAGIPADQIALWAANPDTAIAEKARNDSATGPEARVRVMPNQTIEGRLKGLVDPNNPLMVQAATQAKEEANARGLLNSSMAVSAGQTAMLDQAMKIASQDAQTEANAATNNAQAANIFRAADQKLESDKALLDLQAKANKEMLALQTKANKDIADLEAQYRTMAQASASAVSILNTMTSAVAAVLADTNMDAPAKQAALDVHYANASSALKLIGALNGDVDLSALLDDVLGVTTP